MTTFSAENDISEVADVIGTVIYSRKMLCTSDSIDFTNGVNQCHLAHMAQGLSNQASQEEVVFEAGQSQYQ